MNTEVQNTKRDVKTLLQSPTVIAQMQRIATKHLPADRLARLLLSAVNKTPQLLNCTPESVLQAGMACSQLGVEPDGRHAHLLPYGNQCQLIVGYQGLIAIARRNGVEAIVSDIVCESDEFTYFRDESGTHFKHVPKFGERGKIIGAYAMSKLNGECDIEVMTVEEIDSIRNRSRAGKNGPWVTDYSEMARKTAIRRLSKRWPLSAEVAEAIVAGDDDTLEGTPRQKVEVKSPSFLDKEPYGSGGSGGSFNDGPGEAGGGAGQASPAFISEPAIGGPMPTRRGRPRKESPAQALGTSKGEHTSELATPESEPPPRVINYASGLRKLLAIEKITEGEWLNYLNQTAKVTGLPTSLEDLVLTNPDVAKAAFDEWQSIVNEFRNWVESEEEA